MAEARDNLKQVDYSDCVRHFRECVVLLNQLAVAKENGRELLDIVSFLERTALCLEQRQEAA